jgi:hypothetical protein
MRTIDFCTIVGGLSLVAMTTGVAAQDRSDLLTSIDVKQLVASARPEDEARLRDHFAALADEYSTRARRYRAMAQGLMGNPNHLTTDRWGASWNWGAHWIRLAEESESSSATLRALSEYHEQLAAGQPSQPPPNSVRFEAGEGAPSPNDAQLRALAARARTRADHLGLAEYFEAVAERQTDAANKYTAFARLYQVTPRRTVGGDPVIHYDRMARRSRESAAQARAQAAKQRQLAQVVL